MPAQATVSLEKAKRREPAKASIREALGIAYFRLRRYEEAESSFARWSTSRLRTTTRTYGLARALEKLGRTSEARGHLKLARSLRPGSEHYAERLRALE
jgi:Flp pilus assembly protein TadD